MKPPEQLKKAREIAKKILELRQQGKEWPEIQRVMKRITGKKLSPSTLRWYISSEKLSKLGLPSEPREHAGKDGAATLPSKHNERSVDNVQPSLLEPKESSEQSAHAESLPKDLENRIREIATAVCTELIHDMGSVPPITKRDDDLPPEARTVKGSGRGRRETRTYVKLSGTIDKNLWGLFEKERTEQGLSVGKLLDAILWNRYGRPKLTYESE